MKLRICLIIAILAGTGVIVLTQWKVREHIRGIIVVRNDNIQGRADELAGKLKSQAELADTRSQLASTTTKLNTTEASLASTNLKLADAEAAKVAVTKDLEKVREEKNTAQQELARWVAVGIRPDQVKQLVADLKTSQKIVAVMEQEKKKLLSDIAIWKSQFPDILSCNEDDVMLCQVPLGLKGMVKVVDPKWDFVVLDIGANQGVMQNGVMLVHRDSKLIGKVKIVNVMGDRCVANILPGWKLKEIQEGDQVLF